MRRRAKGAIVAAWRSLMKTAKETATRSRNGVAAHVRYVGFVLSSMSVLALSAILASSAVAGSRNIDRKSVHTTTRAAGQSIWYSTLFGGSYGDAAHAVAVDRWGNIYLAGDTVSPNFPIHNAVQRRLGRKARSGVETVGDDAGCFGVTNFAGCSVDGARDAFVVKLSPRGRVIYSTYLGGNDLDDARAITVDAEGNAYVAGYTHSQDFPVLHPLKSGFARDDYCRIAFSWCQDAFVAKLDPSGRLLFSTYFGGKGRNSNGGLSLVQGDDAADAIAVDRRGDIYIAGTTDSVGFPGTSGQPVSGAFVSKLSPQGNRVLGTFVQAESLSAFSPLTTLALDPTGDVVVTTTDFLLKLSPSLRRIYALRLQGNLQGDPGSVTTDRWGNAYVTGTLESDHFTVVHAAQPRFGGGKCHETAYLDRPCTDAFLMKVDPRGKTVYSTFLGGSGDDEGRSVAVDSFGSAYVAGITSGSFPIKNAIQPDFGGGAADAFVVKIAPSGDRIVYSTYLGGSGLDFPTAIALTPGGAPVITGETDSGDFPISPDGARRSVSDSSASRVFVTRLPASPRTLVQHKAGQMLWRTVLSWTGPVLVFVVFGLVAWYAVRRRAEVLGTR
jgi:hypothetical protein